MPLLPQHIPFPSFCNWLPHVWSLLCICDFLWNSICSQPWILSIGNLQIMLYSTWLLFCLLLHSCNCHLVGKSLRSKNHQRIENLCSGKTPQLTFVMVLKGRKSIRKNPLKTDSQLQDNPQFLFIGIFNFYCSFGNYHFQHCWSTLLWMENCFINSWYDSFNNSFSGDSVHLHKWLYGREREILWKRFSNSSWISDEYSNYSIAWWNEGSIS